MKKLPPVTQAIESLVPYQQGKPIAELERELGLSNIIKLASNECPLGASPKALAAMQNALPEVFRYPDGGGVALRQALAQHYNLSVEQICLGNGSNEIIEMLCRAFIQPGGSVLSVAPSFLMYEKLVQVAGGSLREVPLSKDYHIDLKALLAAVEPDTRLIFINHPNNPAGTIVSQEEMAEFLERVPPGIIVVLDEAYIDFCEDSRCAHGENFLTHPTPVVVMRTFSKISGLAGLRIGYALASRKIIDYFNRVRQPFNTSLLAQAAALGALQDTEFSQKHVRLVAAERRRYYKAFEELGLFYVPSQTNFVLVRIGAQALEIFQEMLKRGVILRWMGFYNLPEFIRISIGLPEENIRCLQGLRQLLKGE